MFQSRVLGQLRHSAKVGFADAHSSREAAMNGAPGAAGANAQSFAKSEGITYVVVDGAVGVGNGDAGG
jgi:hypothetical protein